MGIHFPLSGLPAWSAQPNFGVPPTENHSCDVRVGHPSAKQRTGPCLVFWCTLSTPLDHRVLLHADHTSGYLLDFTWTRLCERGDLFVARYVSMTNLVPMGNGSSSDVAASVAHMEYLSLFLPSS